MARGRVCRLEQLGYFKAPVFIFTDSSRTAVDTGAGTGVDTGTGVEAGTGV